MFSSGSELVDEFLGDLPSEEVVMVYGDPASGKTTLAFQISLEFAKKGKRVVFVDVENTFSLDRLRQMDSNCDSYLDNIKVFLVNDFDEQEKVLLNIPFNVDLVIVDSMSKYYRAQLKKEPAFTNERVIRMLRKLHKFVDRNIPVMITNQVYSNMDGTFTVVGGNMIKRWSQFLIRLQKSPRKLFLEKPMFKEISFRIDDSGIVR